MILNTLDFKCFANKPLQQMHCKSTQFSQFYSKQCTKRFQIDLCSVVQGEKYLIQPLVKIRFACDFKAKVHKCFVN